MSLAHRLTAAVVVGAMLMVATVGVAGAKPVVNEVYAKQVCEGVSGVLLSLQPLLAADTSDLAAYQEAAVDGLDAAAAASNAAGKSIAKASPKSGGRKVAAIFSDFFDDRADAFENASEEFADSDPTKAGFAVDVSLFVNVLEQTPLGLIDPFVRVFRTKALRGAFTAEPSCESVLATFD